MGEGFGYHAKGGLPPFTDDFFLQHSLHAHATLNVLTCFQQRFHLQGIAGSIP
jgi:hypothetical protein